MLALVALIVVLLVFVAILYGSIVLIDAVRNRFWKDFSTQYPPHYNYDSSYVSGDNSFIWSDSDSCDCESLSSDGSGDCNDRF